MSIAVNIISAVIKSIVGDQVGNDLANEVIGISVDGLFEKGMDRVGNFIDDEKAKIEHILSKGNMKAMNIPAENIDYVVAEIKDLLSEVEITDEVLRQCKYNKVNLSDFLWNEYCEYKNNYFECESDVKKGLFAISEALITLVCESEAFEKDVLIYIISVSDDTNMELQKISEYINDNFDKLNSNSKIIIDILLIILEKIQKKDIQEKNTNEGKKFKNNRKQDYIKNWNSKLFLHADDDEKPITLADAFIMPDYKIHKNIQRMDYFYFDTLDKVIKEFVEYEKTSTMLIMGVPGIGKSSIASWMANEYKDDDRFLILRFRDWDNEELENGLLRAICNKLECKNTDLKYKILILDGFDEMKSLDIRARLLNAFFNDIKDRHNFKCIITSRTAYIDSSHFQNVIELKEFNIDKVYAFFINSYHFFISLYKFP